MLRKLKTFEVTGTYGNPGDRVIIGKSCPVKTFKAIRFFTCGRGWYSECTVVFTDSNPDFIEVEVIDSNDKFRTTKLARVKLVNEGKEIVSSFSKKPYIRKDGTCRTQVDVTNDESGYYGPKQLKTFYGMFDTRELTDPKELYETSTEYKDNMTYEQFLGVQVSVYAKDLID